MPLFSRTSPPAAREQPDGRPTVSGIWTDAFGRLASRSLQIALVVILLAAIVFTLLQLTVVIIPVLLALIIASAIAPLVGFLRRHHVPSALATAIALVGIVVVLGGVIWLVVLAVESQAGELVGSATNGFEQFQTFLGNLPFSIDQDQIDRVRQGVIDFVTSQGFGSSALAGLSAAGNFLTSVAVFVVVLFFFVKDGPRIWDFLLRPFQGSGYERAQRVGDVAVSTLGGYVRGTAIVAAVDAVGIGVGLAVIQVPLALPLAVVVFVSAFVPIVGATAAGIIAALVALVSNGPVAALAVVGVVILVNQLEGNLLQPVVMGKTLKLHPLVILLALTVGTILGGIVGAILAVPLTAVGWSIIGVWDGPDTPARFARPKRHERMT